MAANSLSGKRVAILATDGVEQVELTEPRKALDAAGAITEVVSPKNSSIKAVRFVRSFFEACKPVAAICHGPWLLVEADVVQGRHVTSWPSLQTDLENAGAQWTDREVVVDHGLVTSRNPNDIPAFNEKMIEEFAEGVHEEQRASAHAGSAH